jgi:hypothetical protein
VGTQVVQGVVDLLFPVAAVGGDGAGCAAGTPGDPLHGGRELRRVGGVALLDGVVQDHAVVVVGQLGLVPELDRPAEPALGDRAGVGVVQADPPGRPVRGHARENAGRTGEPRIAAKASAGRCALLQRQVAARGDMTSHWNV